MASLNNAPGPNEPPPPYSASSNTPPAAPAPSASPAPVSHTPSFDSASQGPPPPQPERPSAAQYFASRQPSHTARVHVHTLSVLPNSVRADFPYPQEWAPSRDVSPQDWETFIGFLIPDAAVTRDAKRLSDERRMEIDTTLRQWNDGFFVPRGATVRLDDPFSSSGHGGSSEAGPSSSSWNAATPSPSVSAGPSHSSAGFGGPSTSQWNAPVHPPHHQQQSFASSNLPPRQEPLGMSTTDRWAKKLRKVAAETKVTNQGIHYSDKFAMDMHRIKVGKIVLDMNGMHTEQSGAYGRPGTGQQYYQPPQQQHGGHFGGPPAAYISPHNPFQQPQSTGSYQSPIPPHGHSPTPPPQLNRWGMGQAQPPPPPQEHGYAPGPSYGGPSEDQHGPPQTGVIATGPPAGEKVSR